MEEDSQPRMKSVKKMYDDMTTAPTRPSMGHTTKPQDIASSMFEAIKPKKMAKGGCCRGDGIAQRGRTKGRMV